MNMITLLHFLSSNSGLVTAITITPSEDILKLRLDWLSYVQLFTEVWLAILQPREDWLYI